MLAEVEQPIVHRVEKLLVKGPNHDLGKILWAIFFTFLGGGVFWTIIREWAGGILSNRQKNRLGAGCWKKFGQKLTKTETVLHLRINFCIFLHATLKRLKKKKAKNKKHPVLILNGIFSKFNLLLLDPGYNPQESSHMLVFV